MEWQILYRYFEELWEDRWLILVLQLVMVSAIVVIGTAINMIRGGKWIEEVPFYPPINGTEGSLCRVESHVSR